MVVDCMMTRREWILAGLGLLLFEAVAALVMVPRIERKLNEAAAEMVGRLDREAGGGRFDRVRVVFEGQRAKLTGAVRNEADARRLIEALRQELRTPGNRWNPVVGLEVGKGMEVRPLEAGWLVAGVRGYELEVVGVCATEGEREALKEGLRSRWPIWKGGMEWEVGVESRRFDESKRWARALETFPGPIARGKLAARLMMLKIGEGWKELVVEEGEQSRPSDEELKRLGVTAMEWQRVVGPMRRKVDQHRQEEVAWEAEQERLKRLPLAHVFFGRRGKQVLLRGEVYDEESKRALIAMVMTAMPGMRILDDVRAAGMRRPGTEWEQLLEVLGQGGEVEKAFALAVPGQDWAVLDWQIGKDQKAWSGAESEGMDKEGLRADSVVVIDWLQGGHAGIPTLAAPLQPAFLTLAAFSGRVVLGGQLAEEALRAQVVAAVKRSFTAGWVVRDEIAVSGRCEASESVQHTVLSVPEPPLPGAFVLAAAVPGQSWRLLPRAVLEDETILETEGLLPMPLAGHTVAAGLSDVLEEMRALGLRFAGKETSGNKPMTKKQ